MPCSRGSETCGSSTRPISFVPCSLTTTTKTKMARRRAAKKEIKNVVLYARVSTAEQAERDLSLPAQTDAMRRYCAEHKYEVVTEYVEPGASGRDEHRPVFRKMMEEVLSPSSTVDAVLVYQTSRFMRDAGKARAFKDALRKSGIKVIAICQETSDDPMGQFIEGVFELVDQYESDVNGMRTRAAMLENAKRGFVNGSQAPFGFKVEKIDQGGVPRNRLSKEPDEAATVVKVFATYVHQGGAKATARELNQRGYRHRGKLWSKDRVLKVIAEEAAVGRYYWGKTDARSGVMRDREDWICVPVEPLITEETFALAQKVRADRDPEKHPGRASSSPLLLAGLVTCGKCGASYQLDTSGKLDPSGRSYRYYNCRTASRTGKEACAGHRLPAERFEQQLLEHIAEQVFSKDRCKLILRDMIEESGVLRQRTAEDRRQLQRELDDIDRRIARWQEAFEAGELPREAGAGRVLELQAKRDEIASALAKVVPLRPPPPHLHGDAALERFQKRVKQIFFEGDRALTRNYLRFLVDRIVVNGPTVEISMKAAEAAALIALPADAALTAPDEVRTTVGDWLQLLDSNQGPGG